MTSDLHARIAGTIAQSEKEVQAAVIQYAKVLGYRVYHTFDSRRSERGFPDLVIAGKGRTIYAELKTEKGRVSPSQQEWIDTLAASGQTVYVWRPSQWDAIEEVLR